MDNSTVINPAIQGTSSTVINSEVVEEYNRQNNIEADASSSISEGTVICKSTRFKANWKYHPVRLIYSCAQTGQGSMLRRYIAQIRYKAGSD